MDQPSSENQSESLTDKQMITEIYQNSKKSVHYAKWQMYIILVLIVLPLLVGIVLMVMTIKSLGTPANLYTPGGTVTQ